MKERYENAELEVMKFALEDVISTSAEMSETTSWSPDPHCPAESPPPSGAYL